MEGLRYLHEDCKLIHTDIKPDNILVYASDSAIRRVAIKSIEAQRCREKGLISGGELLLRVKALLKNEWNSLSSDCSFQERMLQRRQGECSAE